MARKKKAGKAVGPAIAKLPANWKEIMRGDVVEESERTPTGSGNNITLKKNGQFEFQGANLGDSIDVVVLDHVILKKWYESAYDPENPGPPSCFALKPSAKNIAPHSDSPNVQAEVCDDCPQNEWASGHGRGKACQDKHRIALLHSDALENGVDIILLESPVTSGANFNAYITSVNKAVSLPSYGVVTRITMDEHSDWQKLIFKMLQPLPQALLAVTMNKRREAREMLLTPYDVSGYKKKKVSKKKGSKKKTAKKKKRSRLS